MVIITDTEIYNVLQPHLTAIRKFHDDALLHVNKIMDFLDKIKTYKRTRATLLNNLVVEYAKEYFKTINGIEVDERYETLILRFPEGVLSRFKKISKYTLLSCHSNNKRNANLIQGTLFDEFPPSVFVEIGYVINIAWSAFDKISIVKRVEKIGIELFKIEQEELQTQTLKAVEVNPETEQEENQLTIKTS